MDLITRSDDERLTFDTLCSQCGPRPAFDEDGLCASCGCDTQGPGVEVVMQSLRAALAAKDKAEAALCRAREATNQPITGDNWTRVISNVLHIIAPDNSAPCPHEEREKRVEADLARYREAVDDIPALIRGHKSHWQEPLDKFQRDQLMETVAKHVEYKLAELRRRVEGR